MTTTSFIVFSGPSLPPARFPLLSVLPSPMRIPLQSHFNLKYIFRSNFEATPQPILIDNGVAILENDRIERHIMKNIPGGHNIFVADKEVK